MVYAGIDYSMTSPAICVFDVDENKVCEFNTCFHYFLSTTQRFKNFFEDGIEGDVIGEWATQEQRFDMIAAWAMAIMEDHRVEEVWLEGYSYGSKGKVFHIAENTGLLKNNLWMREIPCEVLAPSRIKKLATGKGNAKKDAMYQAFLKDPGGFNLTGLLTPKSKKIVSPVSDIVDAYFILKAGMSMV